MTTALAAVLLSVYWLEMLRGPDLHPLLRRKPFDCAICLPLWLTLLLGCLPPSVQEAVLALGTAGVLTPLLISLIQRL
jgi:hypothetical protein